MLHFYSLKKQIIEAKLESTPSSTQIQIRLKIREVVNHVSENTVHQKLTSKSKIIIKIKGRIKLIIPTNLRAI